ncbi:hypothetical protein NEIPOLOT_02417 [Neisseria polysaccharea ATCC 43768]|nr:hypothetical protein NEIPOLOT_02417 [Neisseria polysaccharea ATCC 43768]
MGKCRLKGFRRHFCLWASGKMSLEKNIANLKNPCVLISAFLRHSFKGGNLETKKNNRNLSETTKNHPPSSPRKRESSLLFK